MNDTVVEFRTELPASAETVFAWHTREGAFERLTPPWSRASVVRRTGGVEPGARLVIRVPVGPLSRRWVAEHSAVSEGREFSDTQIEGPFAKWQHVHRFEPIDGSRSILHDRIRYRLPFGILGSVAGRRFVKRELERVFAYRHRTTRDDLAMHARYGTAPLSVALTGSSGMVGGAVAQVLSTGGYSLRHLGRSRPPFGEDFVVWDAAQQSLPNGVLDDVDAVVHLAGENIAEGRWTAAKKQRIRESRINSTREIAEAAARQAKPPRVLVCASAIGYYGNRGDELVTETSAPGGDFLAEVCRDWEAACQPARDAGIRVVNLRIGVVLSTRGGALAKVQLPFRMAAGGMVGTGAQYMSWIGLDDLVAIIVQAIRDDSMSGAINAVAPEPCTNREYTKTLGALLSRPTIVPLPALVARAAFGEMADALLLSSTRVEAAKLKAAGFSYRTPTLEQVLARTLGRA